MAKCHPLRSDLFALFEILLQPHQQYFVSPEVNSRSLRILVCYHHKIHAVIIRPIRVQHLGLTYMFIRYDVAWWGDCVFVWDIQYFVLRFYSTVFCSENAKNHISEFKPISKGFCHSFSQLMKRCKQIRRKIIASTFHNVFEKGRWSDNRRVSLNDQLKSCIGYIIFILCFLW